MLRGAIMKKIGVYLGCSPVSGGMFQYAQTMLDAIAALPENEFQTVVAYASDDWLPHLAHYDLPSVRIEKSVVNTAVAEIWGRIGLPIGGWRKLAPMVHPASRQFLKERCDLWVFPSQDSWSYWVPVPALGTIHDLMHRYESRFPEVSAKGSYRRRELHYQRMCRWAKAVLVDSEVGKHQTHESYGLDSRQIYALPYTAPKHIYSTYEPPEFDSKYGLPGKYVFYPAQFWEHKNHKSLVRAAKKIFPVAPDIKLIFVGTKKNGYDSTRELVTSLGLSESVRFIDYVPDHEIGCFYRRARCLMMPTFFGPTNIPPLEAFVAGCPVAASNIYAMPEQLGDAALLFDPKSDEEIAQAMLRLWTDDEFCARLRERGFQRTARWNQSHFNQRLLQIVKELINEPVRDHTSARQAPPKNYAVMRATRAADRRSGG
jgi:glycosyltransferase involved in cell wall biosynthesis